jgi:hypothetical protein
MRHYTPTIKVLKEVGKIWCQIGAIDTVSYIDSSSFLRAIVISNYGNRF